ELRSRERHDRTRATRRGRCEEETSGELKCPCRKRYRSATPRASRFLTGLVTCFATQAGIPSVESAASRLNALGETPTNSVNRVLNVPNDEHPTSKHTSVTLMSPRRSNAIAR